MFEWFKENRVIIYSVVFFYFLFRLITYYLA